MTETKIYIGLNDYETFTQTHDTEVYAGILKDICRNYHVGFSFSTDQGGCFDKDGRYTQETTLVLSLIDVDAQTVNEIAKDICVFFRQDSVLITENEVRTYYVSEKL